MSLIESDKKIKYKKPFYLKIKFKRILVYFLVFLAIIITLLPFYTGFLTAFKTEKDLRTTNPLEPSPNPNLDALYETLFGTYSGLSPLINSFIFTIEATILSCFFGSITGFVFSKMKFKYSEFVFICVILGIFIPYQAVIIPIILTMARLGLYNNILSLIIVHTAYGIPICTLLFRNFYDEIPDSLIEAAVVDGADTLKIYRSVILPLSPIPLAVAVVFQFTNIWNDYLFGLILTFGKTSMPASVWLANLKGSVVAMWHLQMAGTLWYSLPILVIYLLLGKFLMRGFMTGAVKG